jgi:hypothetical protein
MGMWRSCHELEPCGSSGAYLSGRRGQGSQCTCIDAEPKKSNLEEVVFFTSYVLAGKAFPLSSFFLLVLEAYGLQMVGLLLHSVFTLVIFIHLCEMFDGV